MRTSSSTPTTSSRRSKSTLEFLDEPSTASVSQTSARHSNAAHADPQATPARWKSSTTKCRCCGEYVCRNPESAAKATSSRRQALANVSINTPYYKAKMAKESKGVLDVEHKDRARTERDEEFARMELYQRFGVERAVAVRISELGDRERHDREAYTDSETKERATLALLLEVGLTAINTHRQLSIDEARAFKSILYQAGIELHIATTVSNEATMRSGILRSFDDSFDNLRFMEAEQRMFIQHSLTQLRELLLCESGQRRHHEMEEDTAFQDLRNLYVAFVERNAYIAKVDASLTADFMQVCELMENEAAVSFSRLCVEEEAGRRDAANLHEHRAGQCRKLNGVEESHREGITNEEYLERSLLRTQMETDAQDTLRLIEDREASVVACVRYETEQRHSVENSEWAARAALVQSSLREASEITERHAAVARAVVELVKGEESARDIIFTAQLKHIQSLMFDANETRNALCRFSEKCASDRAEVQREEERLRDDTLHSELMAFARLEADFASTTRACVEHEKDQDAQRISAQASETMARDLLVSSESYEYVALTERFRQDTHTLLDREARHLNQRSDVVAQEDSHRTRLVADEDTAFTAIASECVVAHAAVVFTEAALEVENDESALRAEFVHSCMSEVKSTYEIFASELLEIHIAALGNLVRPVQTEEQSNRGDVELEEKTAWSDLMQQHDRDLNPASTPTKTCSGDPFSWLDTPNSCRKVKQSHRPSLAMFRQSCLNMDNDFDIEREYLRSVLGSDVTAASSELISAMLSILEPMTNALAELEDKCDESARSQETKRKELARLQKACAQAEYDRSMEADTLARTVAEDERRMRSEKERRRAEERKVAATNTQLKDIQKQYSSLDDKIERKKDDVREAMRCK
eukprot:PhM_4_TR17642/c0_g2_i1/m.91244